MPAGPVGIERIDQKRKGKWRAVELTTARRWSTSARPSASSTRASPARFGSLLQNVVKQGTATRAQIPGVMVAGKTGTTENYGDAWFVAWTKEYTVAVWVGYPDEFKPMKTEFQGDPVAGGTYPAGIWKTFMQYLLKIDPLPKKDGGDGTGKDIDPESTPTPGAGTVPPPTATVPPVDARDAAGRRRSDGAAADRGATAADRGATAAHRGATAAHRGAAAGDRSGNRRWRSGAPG